MAVPVLKLDLAPPPTPWRQHHVMLGWFALGTGVTALIIVVAATLAAYFEANQAGRNAVLKTEEAKDVILKQQAILERLKAVDVEKDLPAWRLAERILAERSLPWSRLTAELERSMVQDVRLKSIQRTRTAARSIEVKISGEARSRASEEAFVETLQQNACFTQVVLERELELPNAGVEFELALSVAPAPPPYAPLPKYGPVRPLKLVATDPPVRAPAVKPLPAPMTLPAVGTPRKTVPSPLPSQAPERRSEPERRP